MCGLTGVFFVSPPSDASIIVEQMTRTLLHRGPDAGAVWGDNATGIALGHRRLAILDLSEHGAQPMLSDCGRYVIVFNGEIYNHLDLRRDLQLRGRTHWLGTSDTETLLAGVSEWGLVETLKKCVGMFALALWDRRDQRLTLARDRFGEKPLFYGFCGRGSETHLVFGSELKALRANPAFVNAIDRRAVAAFLRFSYVPAPLSIFEDTYKLQPGCVVEFSRDDVRGHVRKEEPYWRYEDVARAGLATPIGDESEALEALEAALTRAVGLQLVADVPVGAFLSGGIDSSTIVALMQAQSSRPVQTFTVGFDEAGFDESAHAREVSRHLGTDHTEIRVTAEETRAVIPRLPQIYDEPFGDSSQIPTCIVAAVARRSVTVALSGDAGDELFGGYNRYVLGPKLSAPLMRAPAPLRSAIGAAAMALPNVAWSAIAALPGLGASLAPFRGKVYKLGPALANMRGPDDVYAALVTEWPFGGSPALGVTEENAAIRSDLCTSFPERMMMQDGLTYLPDDILTKVDRAAMAVSLETRVPMLDHRVADIAWRLPLDMKIRNGQTKWALRQILYRYVPPDLVERPKAGFAVPIGSWLRGPLRAWADHYLDGARLREGGYLDAPPVEQMWREHRSGARDWTPRLWNLLMFEAWRESQSGDFPSRAR